MKTTRLLLVFFCVLAFLSGCKKDTTPPEDIEKYYLSDIYPDQLHVLIGVVDTIHYSSNAVGLVVKTPIGDITDKDPEQGTVTVIMTEEGMAQIDFVFSWDDPVSTHVTQTCYIFGIKPEEPLTLQVSAKSGHIPHGTSDSIFVSITGAKSVTTDLPGYDGSLSGGKYSTPPLDSTTIYHFSISNEKETVDTSITIEVDEPLPTQEELYLCSGNWLMNKFRKSYTLAGPWVEIQYNYSEPCMQDNFWRFYLPPERLVTYDQGELCSGGIAPILYWNYILSNNILSGLYGFETKTIIYLDWNLLVWIVESSEYNIQTGEYTVVYFEKTFIHP